MKNTILKSMLTLGIIAFAASMLAVSCGKTAGGGGNNNANNSANNSGNGNGGSGGEPTCTGICPSATLTLAPDAGILAGSVKISGNTVVINANSLASIITPHSTADDNRGFQDAIDAAGGSYDEVFDVVYPGATAAIIFVGRTHVTKDAITIPATVTDTHSCSSSETADNTLAVAAAGGACRIHVVNGGAVSLYSYLGTMFNNTKTATHARGTLRCGSHLRKTPAIPGGSNPVVDDALAFDKRGYAVCSMAVVNSGGGAAAAEIDDAWVGDTASTSEVELYAIGIDVSGKTIPQFSSDAGYNLAEFKKAHDNAGFKKLLQNNKWGELKFKVKIVKSSDF